MTRLSMASFINTTFAVNVFYPILSYTRVLVFADELECCSDISYAASLGLYGSSARLDSADNEAHTSAISRRTLGVPKANNSKTYHSTALIPLYFLQQVFNSTPEWFRIVTSIALITLHWYTYLPLSKIITSTKKPAITNILNITEFGETVSTFRH